MYSNVYCVIETISVTLSTVLCKVTYCGLNYRIRDLTTQEDLDFIKTKKHSSQNT